MAYPCISCNTDTTANLAFFWKKTTTLTTTGQGKHYIEINPVRAAMVDDPAHYRWTSCRHNALGQANCFLFTHPLYLALGKGDKTRQAIYRSLFRAELDNEAISDTRLARLALNQNQPLGKSPFYTKVEAMTSLRWEPKPRGRPRKQRDESSAHDAGQGELPI
jgi:putative transposase